MLQNLVRIGLKGHPQMLSLVYLALIDALIFIPGNIKVSDKLQLGFKRHDKLKLTLSVQSKLVTMVFKHRSKIKKKSLFNVKLQLLF